MRQPVDSAIHAMGSKKALLDIARHALVIGVGLFFALPLLWMVATSLKSDRDVFHIPLRLLPYTNSVAQVNGQALPLYDVALDGQQRRLALLQLDEGLATFVNPQRPR